jgi:hypothetical protein
MAVTQVASAAASTTIALTNGARQGIKITNTDANPLYVLLDPNGTATTALYSFVLNTGDTWEDQGENIYRDKIVGIWGADGSGNANVTEW